MKSIRARLTMWYLIVLALGMCALGGSIWVSMRYSLLDILDDEREAPGRSAEAIAAWRKEEVQETLDLLKAVLAGSIPLVVVAAGAGGWWMSRKALEPVRRMSAEAEAITINDLGARLHVPTTGDDLQQLAETWNHLLSRLEASVNRVTRFTADAAHELRTPVALIRTSADIALRQERTVPIYQDTLRSIQNETVRLTGLVEQLMWLARHDSGAAPASMAQLDLGRLAGECVEDLRPIAMRQGLTLHCQTRPLAMNGDLGSLRRLVMILLDNAIKYTQPGGRVDVDFDANSLTVSDTGRGIAPADLHSIFDRFYRADAARNGPGAGLGLAIARQIAEQHGAALEVESTLGIGSRFRLRLHC